MAVSAHDASYALGIVKTICEEIGPGLPGSDQERERAAVFRRELESHLGAGRVVVEEFTVAPWASLGAMPISAAFIAIAALLNLAAGHSTRAEIGIVPAGAARASEPLLGTAGSARSRGARAQFAPFCRATCADARVPVAPAVQKSQA